MVYQTLAQTDLAACGLCFEPGEWHTLAFRNDMGRLEVAVDGICRIAFDDSRPQSFLHRGTVGFRAGEGEAQFRRLLVKGRKAAPEKDGVPRPAKRPVVFEDSFDGDARNTEGCLCYTVSRDGGLSWEGFFHIPELACAMSSFGVCEDPLRSGAYFLVYVPGRPYMKGCLFPRTCLALMWSADGMNWKFVMEIDRAATVSNPMSYEIYQFLDPSILATEQDLYIGYGKSEVSSETYHNRQRAFCVRIRRDRLPPFCRGNREG